MGTFAVTFGTVATYTDPGGYVAVVGGGDQWSDDSDGTYAEMDANVLTGIRPTAYAQQTDDSPAMVSPAVSLTARISGPPGPLEEISPLFMLLSTSQVSADPSGAGLLLGAEADGGVPLVYTDDLGGSRMSTDPDGLAHTYTVDLPYTTDPFAYGVWPDIGTRLAGGGMFMAARVGNARRINLVLRIYEISLTLVTSTRSQPLRRYPPVNNGGFGPTRHWPRTVNRLAGGSR